ncbi:MAG: type III PLP-dependent enzyme domain-containing protein [Acidimicrobiales bacterium]
MVLLDSAVSHNISTMARFCERAGVSLCPHGKTTMSPELFDRQLAAGAWGITVATPEQAATARRFGVGRILLANEVVSRAAAAWLARALDEPGWSFYCLADSVAGVERFDGFLDGFGCRRSISVLVELGWPGARAGCRSTTDAVAVASAVAGARWLDLAGVEGYEGIVPSTANPFTRSPAGTDPVGSFLRALRDLATALDGAGLFKGREEIVVSAGGSAFFDRVVELLAWEEPLGLPVRVVLRSGAYITHDHGRYAMVSPLRQPTEDLPAFRPALELWAEVLSRPEPLLGIVGFGKRDAPYDLGLPVPLLWSRNGSEPTSIAGPGMEITRLDDQHSYLRLPAGQPGEPDLAVGDLLGFGISHPCTAFDKWRVIPLVDDGYRLTGAIHTYF